MHQNWAQRWAVNSLVHILHDIGQMSEFRTGACWFGWLSSVNPYETRKWTTPQKVGHRPRNRFLLRFHCARFLVHKEPIFSENWVKFSASAARSQDRKCDIHSNGRPLLMLFQGALNWKFTLRACRLTEDDANQCDGQQVQFHFSPYFWSGKLADGLAMTQLSQHNWRCLPRNLGISNGYVLDI